MRNKNIKFEKRWEAKHPIYRLEANTRAYIEHSKVPGCECKHMITSINNAVCTIYYDEKELERALSIGDKVINDYKEVKNYIKKADEARDKLLRVSREIYKKDLSLVTNKELKNIYNKYFNSFINLLAYYNLSRPDYLIKIDEKIKKVISSKEPDLNKRDELFAKLTKPVSNNVLTKHEIAQLNFTLSVLNNKKYSKRVFSKSFIRADKNLNKKLSNLINDYSWISTQENNPPFDEKYYIKKTKELLVLGKRNIEKRLHDLENRIPLELTEKKKIIKKYKFSSSFLKLTDNVAALAKLRLNVRLWWTESSYRVSCLFEELNNRINLKNKKFIHWYYSEYLLENEVYNSLDGKIKISAKEIEKRIKKSLLLMINKKIHFFSGKKALKEESRYISKQDYSKIKILKGQIANKGFVRGKVWVISPEITNQVEKANKMKKDFILVAAMTRPQFIEGINKAQAIITDEGGITCHAAIISRELKKPCVVGTKIATKVLKDGDLVLVDANKGIVKIIKKKNA